MYGTLPYREIDILNNLNIKIILMTAHSYDKNIIYFPKRAILLLEYFGT